MATTLIETIIESGSETCTGKHHKTNRQHARVRSDIPLHAEPGGRTDPAAPRRPTSSMPMTLKKGTRTLARLDAPRVCWCGQDLEYARPGHCPRCGTASVTHSRAVSLPPAA